MDRSREIYKVTLMGSAVNAALLIFKFTAGIVGHSAAMVADAVHSLSDFITDIIVLIFVKISGKPQDETHDYGHGKFETLATTIIAIALMGVGIGILCNGVVNVIDSLNGVRLESPGRIALYAAIISIIAKELIFRITYRTGKQLQSDAVIANAWHHRSDALSSVGTAVGIGGAVFLGEKWAVLDPLASAVVAVFIIWISFKMIKEGLSELVEISLPAETENEILAVISSIPGVMNPHELKTRKLGSYIAIEVHFEMDGETSLYIAHETATAVEDKLRERFGDNTHVAVHMEPCCKK